MAILRHEVWVGADGLPGCCLAGPDGEAARRLFAEGGAKLVWTFEACSHFDAMVKYHQYLGREPYTTEYAQDHEPYPDEWFKAQTGT
jgi:hypothetical protein